MLEVANRYEQELQELFMNTWHNEKYMFYNSNTYYDLYKKQTTTWNAIEFVSKDSEGNIIGYIGYDINRTSDAVGGLSIINFTDNKITFGRDLITALTDIFEKFNFRKMNFSVIVGNPIEKSYDKIISKYGGCVVGIKKEHCRLIDGKYYDLKMYEIFKSDYEKNKEV